MISQSYAFFKRKHIIIFAKPQYIVSAAAYIESKHNILCLRNTEYFFSGKEVLDEETLKRLQRLHLRLEEVRNI